MKKNVRTTSLLGILLIAILATSCTPREDVLKIYNWEAYVDPKLVKEFEVEYAKTTGRKFKVQYEIYEDNETMYTKIKRNKADYDLVCPSDYMVDAMIQENLLMPIDQSRIAPMDTYLPWIVGLDYDPLNLYSIPYIYGTLGIMYDPTRPNVDKKDMNSWNALWNPKYKGRMVVKDNIYELYSTAAIFSEHEKLMEKSENLTYPKKYRNALAGTINDFSEEMIEAVGQKLREQKPLLKAYVGDEAKDEMVAGGGGDIGLFWSCDAVYAMDRNQNLEYAIPEEGSSLYVDNWAIPIYARNVEAAYAFLRYISTKDNAKRNMLEAGAPCAIRAAVDERRAELQNDPSLFPDQSAEWKAMYIDALFPSDYTILRLWNLRSYGLKAKQINNMFVKVRSGN